MLLLYIFFCKKPLSAPAYGAVKEAFVISDVKVKGDFKV
jgi:hypothetical protein